jgi:hypothetical protein
MAASGPQPVGVQVRQLRLGQSAKPRSKVEVPPAIKVWLAWTGMVPEVAGQQQRPENATPHTAQCALERTRHNQYLIIGHCLLGSTH